MHSTAGTASTAGIAGKAGTAGTAGAFTRGYLRKVSAGTCGYLVGTRSLLLLLGTTIRYPQVPRASALRPQGLGCHT